jgi:hypothetical protein
VKTCQLWTNKCPAGRIFILLNLSKKSVGRLNILKTFLAPKAFPPIL